MSEPVVVRVGNGRPVDADPYFVLHKPGLSVQVVPREARIVLTDGDTVVALTGATRKANWRYGDPWLAGVTHELGALAMYAQCDWREAAYTEGCRERMRAAIQALAVLEDRTHARGVIAFHRISPVGANLADWAQVPVRFAKGTLAHYRALGEVAKGDWDAATAGAFFAEGGTPGELHVAQWAKTAKAGWTFRDYQWASQGRNYTAVDEGAPVERIRLMQERRFDPHSHRFYFRIAAREEINTLIGSPWEVRCVLSDNTPSPEVVEQQNTFPRRVYGRVGDDFVVLQTCPASPWASSLNTVVAFDVVAMDGRCLRILNDGTFGTGSLPVYDSMKDNPEQMAAARWWFEALWSLGQPETDTALVERSRGWLLRLFPMAEIRSALPFEVLLDWAVKGHCVPVKDIPTFVAGGWTPEQASAFIAGRRDPDLTRIEDFKRFAMLDRGWTLLSVEHVMTEPGWEAWLDLPDPDVGKVVWENQLLFRHKGCTSPTTLFRLIESVGTDLAREVLKTGTSVDEAIAAHTEGTLSAEGMRLVASLELPAPV